MGNTPTTCAAARHDLLQLCGWAALSYATPSHIAMARLVVTARTGQLTAPETVLELTESGSDDSFEGESPFSASDEGDDADVEDERQLMTPGQFSEVARSGQCSRGTTALLARELAADQALHPQNKDQLIGDKLVEYFEDILPRCTEPSVESCEQQQCGHRPVIRPAQCGRIVCAQVPGRIGGYRPVIFTFANGPTLVVSVRGTKDKTDVATDMRMWKATMDIGDVGGVAPRVHGGFLDYALVVYKQIERHVRIFGQMHGDNPECGLVIVGHSLGAAVAHLVALLVLRNNLLNNGQSIRAVGFATPRYATADFATAINAELLSNRFCLETVSFVNDPVSMLDFSGSVSLLQKLSPKKVAAPPTLANFAHTERAQAGMVAPQSSFELFSAGTCYLIHKEALLGRALPSGSPTSAAGQQTPASFLDPTEWQHFQARPPLAAHAEFTRLRSACSAAYEMSKRFHYITRYHAALRTLFPP